jgi:hypothetical protein
MEVRGQLHAPDALPQYPSYRRLVRPQSRSGRCGEKKNLTLAGISTPAVQSVAIPAELTRTTENKHNKEVYSSPSMCDISAGCEVTRGPLFRIWPTDGNVRHIINYKYNYWGTCFLFSNCLILLLLISWQIRPCGLFPFRIHLKLWILERAGRSPWTGDQPVARPLTTQNNTNTDILAHSFQTGIRTHDPSIRAGGDISCLRPRGHCHRLVSLFFYKWTVALLWYFWFWL